jgi:hypothetical protein
MSKHADYRVVASGLYSEKFFEDRQSEFWVAVKHVGMHQARFLTWDYTFLLIESAAVSWLTAMYGSLRQVWWYDNLVGKVLLRRASQFPKSNAPKVLVDVIVSDGHLYRRQVGDFFLTANGDLASLLVKEVKRFKYAEYQSDLTGDASRSIKPGCIKVRYAIRGPHEGICKLAGALNVRLRTELFKIERESHHVVFLLVPVRLQCGFRGLYPFLLHLLVLGFGSGRQMFEVAPA